ncbi:hypothetical protein [Mucisphaera sp.]|uniref:hypothetical protein n=1 Tax=Mucisphaera sp. TaxID=2913024 RepID=UPI003D0D5F91
MSEPPQTDQTASLEGTHFEPANDTERADAIDKAFDYRGDVTLHLTTGNTAAGYLFDRRKDAAVLRLMTPDGQTQTIPYDQIKSIAMTGKDPATGRSWETWVSKYIEKKRAGQEASMYGPDTTPSDDTAASQSPQPAPK